MVVSGGIIVLSWLATLALPLISLLKYYSHDEWYMKILIIATPVLSATSTFLIICSTSILAAYNRNIVTVLLMTKLALLYSGFSWASSVDLLHRLNWDLDLNLEIFTIASVSQGAGMLVLAIIGASFRVFSIWTGQDRPNPQQENAAQHQDQQQQKKRRWIRIFALTLVACWILLSGLQVGWWWSLPAHELLAPIYLVPGLLRDSTIILVLTNLGLLGYSLESLWVVFATIIFAVAYTTNSTIYFLMHTVRCLMHNNCNADFLYFSVTIFFNMISLTAAILALLSVVAKLCDPISSGNRSGVNNIQQMVNPGEGVKGSSKEEDANRGEERPPAYGTLVPCP